MNVGEKIVEQLMWWANGLNGIDFGYQAKELLVAAADYIESCEMAKKHGHWVSLTDCANAGAYCSVCNKKVYKEDYALCKRKNKLRSNYCPNCGAKMDEVTAMDDMENVPNVKRLVDANKLIDFIDVGHLRHPGELCYSEVDVANLLLHAPTINAVEVVRCRECKHCYPENYHCDHPMGTAAPLSRKPDDFCSYGELKDSAD